MLQSMRSQRVRHDLEAKQQQYVESTKRVKNELIYKTERELQV